MFPTGNNRITDLQPPPSPSQPQQSQQAQQQPQQQRLTPIQPYRPGIVSPTQPLLISPTSTTHPQPLSSAASSKTHFAQQPFQNTTTTTTTSVCSSATSLISPQHTHHHQPSSAPPAQIPNQLQFKPGLLVWAKNGRNPFWPGQIVDPKAKECTQILPKVRSDSFLVHFFGTYDYFYIAPGNIIAFHPSHSDRMKKSRSSSFIRACQEATLAFSANQFPDTWEVDDVATVQASLDKLKQSRPDVVHKAEEEGRLLSLGLITQHGNGFKPLVNPGNDSKAKKRREYRQSVMQRMALCSPSIDAL